MKQHLLVGLLTLSAFMGGCASKDKGPKTAEIKPVPVNSFNKTWYADLGLKGAKAQNVYVFDELIIVYASDNTAHVVDRKTGTLKFIHLLPRDAGQQHAPSVFGDRIVYPATSALKVYWILCRPMSRRFLTSGNRTAFVSGIGSAAPQFTPRLSNALANAFS